MTKEEYLNRRKELMDALNALKQEYADSQPIKAPRMVMVDGQKKYLKMYKIIDGEIYPCLYNLSRFGKPLASTYPVSKNQHFKPI